MGAQTIGERKRRRAERETGFQIDRLLRLSNRTWEARVERRRGHVHVRIDPVTWKHSRDDGAPCWSSCSTRRLVSRPARWRPRARRVALLRFDAVRRRGEAIVWKRQSRWRQRRTS